MSRRVEVLANEQAVAERAAERTIELAKQRIAEQGRFSIALSGGSTPKLFHRALAARNGELDWSKIHVFYSDERAVPPGHEHSNHRMAEETLLRAVPIPAANVHRIRADDGDSEQAAKAYEQELLAYARDGALDLVLLGMGGDGHTASLFPGREPEGGGLVVAATAPKESPIERRVTFSYDALKRARMVMVLVTGESKAERLAQVMSRASDLPLGKVVHSRAADTLLLVDEAAASKLPHEEKNRGR